MNDKLIVKGARENNLKNIDLEIPRDKLVVFTGLSGSGKTSLAFDTIYAEGQRRYVESLSSYARMFLGQMDKPDVDMIDGLSPAISIDQKTTSRNPRSTVGTVTEIHDYLRLLYAHIGHAYCPKCGKEIKRQTIDQIVDITISDFDGKRVMLSAPVASGKKGEYKKELASYAKQGYARAIIDGSMYTLDEEISLDKNKRHNIDVVVDRVQVSESIRSRIAESTETALNLSGGLLKVIDADSEETRIFSRNFACVDCGISFPEIAPRMFSFNSPFGACEHCTGLGFILKIDEDLVVKNKGLSLNEGAIRVNGFDSSNDESFGSSYFRALAEKYHFSLDTPFKDLPRNIQEILLYGNDGEKIKVSYSTSRGEGYFMSGFEGIIHNMERRYRESTSEWSRTDIESYMNEITCPVCKGDRLKVEALSVKVGGKNIAELSKMTVVDIATFLHGLMLTETEQLISANILKELYARLKFLSDVGLDYLTLFRSAGTLSGGEAQRIRLATQIGSGLTGVLYVLDEPSIGLHQRDNKKLLSTLFHLRDLGNTLIVVEHDEETMRAADCIVDIGPGAGREGGKVVAVGSVDDLIGCKESITGKYLSGEKKIPVPGTRRAPTGTVKVRGARQNNLKSIDVEFPLGVMTAITGVSGSGKSTLINDVLLKALAGIAGEYDGIEGADLLDKIVDIDQSPIGRTPRSNPATYTGIMTAIRDIFAKTPEAKAKGYTSGRFSFNVKGGRCEHCQGDGVIKIEMHFLPDIYVPCEVCRGKRYSQETLSVKVKGKDISDVLDMTVEDAYDFFKNVPSVENKLKLLMDVGLAYMKLGQPSTTLSGGEAQRIKLSTYLSKRQTGSTLFILDEPTTGLHTHDVGKLIAILDRLVEMGNTVIVIEHNLDVIKCADHIIDLGPEGGDRGGSVIATGTPEQVSKVKGSYTGEFIAKVL